MGTIKNVRSHTFLRAPHGPAADAPPLRPPPQATLRNGGRVRAVIPTAFIAQGERPRSAEIPPEIDEDGIPEAVDSESAEALAGWRHVQTTVAGMHPRKKLMAKLSDGFVALPGGLGTLEELAEMVTWTQLGIHKKPVVLLNINGFFDGLRTFIDSYVARRPLPYPLPLRSRCGAVNAGCSFSLRFSASQCDHMRFPRIREPRAADVPRQACRRHRRFRLG